MCRPDNVYGNKYKSTTTASHIDNIYILPWQRYTKIELSFNTFFFSQLSVLLTVKKPLCTETRVKVRKKTARQEMMRLNLFESTHSKKKVMITFNLSVDLLLFCINRQVRVDKQSCFLFNFNTHTHHITSHHHHGSC